MDQESSWTIIDYSWWGKYKILNWYLKNIIPLGMIMYCIKKSISIKLTNKCEDFIKTKPLLTQITNVYRTFFF